MLACCLVGQQAYCSLLLFKMLLVGMRHGGLSDETVEGMVNVYLHLLGFLGLSLEDDVPDHSVLPQFRMQLKKA
jgi:transposase, IS5 family